MDDTTIEALCEVLQDMTTAIELISSGEALINFIEEMLKTIEAWAAKYNVILDDGGMAMESAQAPDVNDHKDVKPPLNQQREHNHTQGEPCHQHSESSKQHEDRKEEKGREEFLHSSKNETQRNEKQGVDRLKAKLLRRVSRKTRSQAELSSDGGSMHIDGTAIGDGVAKMNSPEPLTESPKTDATPAADATTPSQAVERTEDVTESPDWLPKGWITELKVRGTGGSAGSKDKYYFDPTSNRRFRSKKEVLAFLGTTKRKRGRPRKSESLGKPAQSKDESAGHTDPIESIKESDARLNPEAQLPSNTIPDDVMTTPGATSTIATSTLLANDSTITSDATKRKRGRPKKIDSVKIITQAKDEPPGHATAVAQAECIPEVARSPTVKHPVPSNSFSNTTTTPPVTASSTAASLVPLNSGIPMPHQSGPTSEWLVYESLASLPFPMFEHLRLVESNANKLATNNSPPSLWPWMLGNAEGLKKPIVENRVDESKPSEGSIQDKNTSAPPGETEVGEVVPKRPKKAARKNAS